VAEALANGVPPIGSDRGGIPELCAEGGFVLHVPRSLDLRSLSAVAPEVVRPWVELIALLFGKDAMYSQASARARLAGERYLPPRVTVAYVKFFESLIGERKST